MNYQIAAEPVSPVRTRVTESSGATQTLPSPMVPEPADLTITPTRVSASASSGQHLDANLRNEIHGVFGATVNLGVATLAAVTVSLRHGQTVNTCGSEGFLDIVKLYAAE